MKKEEEKKMKINEIYCYRCGSLNVKVLSDGTRICKNPRCLAITRYDVETNMLETKIKVNRK